MRFLVRLDGITTSLPPSLAIARDSAKIHALSHREFKNINSGNFSAAFPKYSTFLHCRRLRNIGENPRTKIPPLPITLSFVNLAQFLYPLFFLPIETRSWHKIISSLLWLLAVGLAFLDPRIATQLALQVRDRL